MVPPGLYRSSTPAVSVRESALGLSVTVKPQVTKLWPGAAHGDASDLTVTVVNSELDSETCATPVRLLCSLGGRHGRLLGGLVPLQKLNGNCVNLGCKATDCWSQKIMHVRKLNRNFKLIKCSLQNRK